MVTNFSMVAQVITVHWRKSFGEEQRLKNKTRESMDLGILSKDLHNRQNLGSRNFAHRCNLINGFCITAVNDVLTPDLDSLSLRNHNKSTYCLLYTDMPAPTALLRRPEKLAEVEDGMPKSRNLQFSAADRICPDNHGDEVFVDATITSSSTQQNTVSEYLDSTMQVDEEGHPKFPPAKVEKCLKVEARKVPIPPQRFTPLKLSVTSPLLLSAVRLLKSTVA